MPGPAPFSTMAFHNIGLPEIQFTIIIPDWLLGTKRMEILHNKISKAAMTEVLLRHHKQRMPGHFKQSARQKYRHRPRNEIYKFRKRQKFRSILDIVKTGRTKRRFTMIKPLIQIGGSGTDSKGIRGRAFYRFPFPAAKDNKPQSVTTDQLAKELSTILREEREQIAEQYGQAFMTLLFDELETRPRIRKKIAPKLQQSFGG